MHVYVFYTLSYSDTLTLLYCKYCLLNNTFIMPIGTRRSTRLKASESTKEDISSIETQGRADKRKSAKNIASRGNKKVALKISETAHTTVITPSVGTSEDKSVSVKAKVPSDCEASVGVKTEAQVEGEEKITQSGDCIRGQSRHGEGETVTDGEKVKEEVAEEDLEVLRKANEAIVQRTREVYKKESVMRHQIKGKPKSGRSWKTEQTARFSYMRKDKPLRSSWQLKMAQKAEKLSVRKYQEELHDAKRQAIVLKKQRREEHKKRKEENQKKSEIVQVIRNTAKLKRMKKKQLRQIQKR